jgi:arginyl-tRNA synthetase
MGTPLSKLERAFRAAIVQTTGAEADPLVAPSGNPQFADYQCNAAMGLAKLVKGNPRQTAEKLKSAAEPLLAEIASEVSVAGPGFINVRLAAKFVEHEISVATTSAGLGVDRVSNPLTVVVDYCGVNAAKEMHVGHLRSTIIGDAICNVLEFLGHKVIRQNHVGDWGTQFGMLIADLKSIPDGENAPIKDLEGFYRAAKQRFDADPAFAAEARRMVVTLQSGDAHALKLWTKILDATRDHYEAVCKRLGVNLTRADERGESSYNDDLANVVRELKGKGLAVESDGATAVFIDGEDKSPLIVEKTGGGYLYGTTDLAAVRYRAGTLHADRALYFVDQRQSQHFHQVFATAEKMGWTGHAKFEHAGFGTMMGPDGKPFKTRSGDVVKLADLLDEAEERALVTVREKNPDFPDAQQREIARMVGIGAVKYSDLSKDRVSDYAFDWDRILSFQGNTAPYLQYAHARIRSIFRKANIDPQFLRGPVHLTEPTEFALAKFILRFGEILDQVARELKPHLLCAYVYDLSGKFSAFYEACEVNDSPEPTRTSRLLLCHATALTLKTGLTLLGIECPEQM